MDDKTILIIGANGQLGKALQQKYMSARAVDSDQLDITNLESLKSFNWAGVSTIINAAGYTNVDGAETAEGRVTAWRVNAVGAANLARVAHDKGLTLVHISTDYVFDGTQDNHSENEPFSPLGVYAQTKAAGDIAVSQIPKHFILRTSWVIGDGPNFVKTMLDLGQKEIAPTVVSDQIGRLTFTSELVKAIDHLLTAQPGCGTYNITNDGTPASWADITREIYKLAGFDYPVKGIDTATYFAGKPEAAPRPLKSTLSLNKIQSSGFQSTDWQADLADYIKKEQA